MIDDNHLISLINLLKYQYQTEPFFYFESTGMVKKVGPAARGSQGTVRFKFFRIRTNGAQGNQVHVWALIHDVSRFQKHDFHPIPITS